MVLVAKDPAIRRSTGAQDEQDQRQKSKSNLDVLAIDLLGKSEKLCDLDFHLTPLFLDLQYFLNKKHHTST
jgi:hypothetical protein